MLKVPLNTKQTILQSALAVFHFVLLHLRYSQHSRLSSVFIVISQM